MPTGIQYDSHVGRDCYAMALILIGRYP